MPVVVVSLNERDVSIEMLERVSVTESQMPDAIAEILKSPYVQEAVILSTCLRTEVYAFVTRFHDGVTSLEDFFCSRLSEASIKVDELCESLKVYFEEAAVRHLFAVSAGIDSPVVGEGEILRQVKNAWDLSQKAGGTGQNLSLLFRYAVATGKKARSMTAIAQGTTSLAHIAVELASKEHGGSLKDREALVVGAGEMGSKIASVLADKSMSLTIVNRGRARANALAQVYNAKVVEISNLHEAMQKADVVLTALTNDEILITRDMLEKIISKRSKPIVLVDAAIPRAIDPGIKNMERVKLFNMDDLRLHAEKGMDSRRSLIIEVQEIMAVEMERYFEDARGRQAAPLVKSLRSKAYDIFDRELEKNQVFSSMDTVQQEEIRKAFSSGLDKFLHEPTIKIKQAAGTSESEILAQSLRSLFGLQ